MNETKNPPQTITKLKPTDVHEFVAHLDGGTLEPRLAAMLSSIATAVSDHHKKGKLDLKMEFVPFNTGPQITVNCVMSFVKPTLRGKQAEEQKSVTSFYINEGGNLTDFPESQGDMFHTKNK